MVSPMDDAQSWLSTCARTHSRPISCASSTESETPRTAAASKNFRASSSCERADTDYYVHTRSAVKTFYHLEAD